MLEVGSIEISRYEDISHRLGGEKNRIVYPWVGNLICLLGNSGPCPDRVHGEPREPGAGAPIVLSQPYFKLFKRL